MKVLVVPERLDNLGDVEQEHVRWLAEKVSHGKLCRDRVGRVLSGEVCQGSHGRD